MTLSRLLHRVNTSKGRQATMTKVGAANGANEGDARLQRVPLAPRPRRLPRPPAPHPASPSPSGPRALVSRVLGSRVLLGPRAALALRPHTLRHPRPRARRRSLRVQVQEGPAAGRRPRRPRPREPRAHLSARAAAPGKGGGSRGPPGPSTCCSCLKLSSDGPGITAPQRLTRLAPPFGGCLLLTLAISREPGGETHS